MMLGVYGNKEKKTPGVCNYHVNWFIEQHTLGKVVFTSGLSLIEPFSENVSILWVDDHD